MTTRRWGRTVAKPHVTEQALQATIVAAAQRLHWKVYHTYDSRKSAPGFPDLALVKDGKLIFIEAKTESGTLSQEQGEWLTALRLVPGVMVLVCRPVSLDDCLEVLKA